MDYDFNKNDAGRVVGVTVAKLRETLAGLPDDALVVMSKDAEGNRYSPLAAVAHDDEGDGILYEAETTWMGEITYHEDRVEDDGWDCSVDAAADNVARCVVLYPIS